MLGRVREVWGVWRDEAKNANKAEGVCRGDNQMSKAPNRAAKVRGGIIQQQHGEIQRVKADQAKKDLVCFCLLFWRCTPIAASTKRCNDDEKCCSESVR